MGNPRGKASWESLKGKPRREASRESHKSLDPHEGKCETAARAREEIASAGPHSTRGLTPLGRLQKYHKIHVGTGEESSGSGTGEESSGSGTGEESSGSGTDSTQGLTPQHRRERHPKRSALHRKDERNSRVVPPFPESPRCLSPFQGTCFPCTASIFKPRIDSHHGGTWDSPVGQPCGKASWESLVGKPQEKATDPLIQAKGRATLLLQLGRKAHVHAPNRHED